MRIESHSCNATNPTSSPTPSGGAAPTPSIPPNTDPVSLPAPTEEPKDPDQSKRLMEKLSLDHPHLGRGHAWKKHGHHGHAYGAHHGHAYGKLLAEYKKSGPPSSPAPTDPAPTDPAPTDPTDPAPTDPVPTDPAAAIDTEA